MHAKPKTKNIKLNYKVRVVEVNQNQHGCNCTQVIGDCPLGGYCLVNSVVYKAEDIDDNMKINTI